MGSNPEQCGAIAYVRLRIDQSSKYEAGVEKAVDGPSGRTYYFDGPRNSGTSPWAPIYPQHKEDVDFFRDFDAFELTVSSDG
jgi:hypothetical protein